MGMSPRERFLSVLHVEEPDRVPVVEIDVLPGLIRKVLGAEAEGVVDATVHPEAYSRLFIKTYLELGMDAIPAYYRILDSPEITLEGDKTFVASKGGFSKLQISTLWEGGAFKIVGLVSTLEDFERMCENLPNVDPTFHLRIIKKETKGLDIPAFGCIFGGYLSAANYMGLEGIIKAPYENPKLLKVMVDYLSKWQTEIGLEMIDAGVDSIGIGEDFADSHNLFMSPAHFRKFILPALKKQTQTLMKKGVPVMLHHCGNYSMVLEEIVDETGCCCLQPIQPEAMDITDVKRRVGDRVCLCGNISINTLSNGTQEDVAKEVKERIKTCAPGGGYIVGSSHSLIDSVRVDNLHTMIKATRKYGKYK